MAGINDTLTGIDRLLAINALHTQQFEDAAPDRRSYRANHPTEIGVFKCMDGRLHLPVMTNTALGIIQPWRNIGGKFNLGWPALQPTVLEWTDYAFSKGRWCLVVTTYHFARGSEGEDREKVLHRGCKGFDYDTEAARQSSLDLKQQFDELFHGHMVYALQCGIDTDLDALLVHGEDGTVLDMGTLEDTSEENLRSQFEVHSPSMPGAIVRDLIPLLQRNASRVKQIKDAKRPVIEVEHREWILATGRGFDSLHEPNAALIIGPFDPDWDQAIATAAKLLSDNIRFNRIDPTRGLVLWASAPYRDYAAYKRRAAEVKARYLSSRAFSIIQKGFPELLPHLRTLTTTVDLNRRTLDVLDSTETQVA